MKVRGIAREKRNDRQTDIETGSPEKERKFKAVQYLF